MLVLFVEINHQRCKAVVRVTVLFTNQKQDVHIRKYESKSCCLKLLSPPADFYVLKQDLCLDSAGGPREDEATKKKVSGLGDDNQCERSSSGI